MDGQLEDLELRGRQPRGRKIVYSFEQSSARDRQSIDGIGLPALSNRFARVRHQPRWETHDRLTAIEQEPHEPRSA